jgi:hypothetical protein
MQALVLDDPARTRINVEHVYIVRPSSAANYRLYGQEQRDPGAEDC